ncbi:hypothetical protein SASPL_129771 [Salvia splendens]|uniref:Retrovirus-related Pol polyprotein from transposon TNT 1-94-like beta-barrel domain-containing protein n=1 Tax=Salvia splendens TaxID=180675 RepID=A0A8X8ZNS6_SALSN|nr:hypothetical protein SASPL_129771 [Salvia splendens]
MRSLLKWQGLWAPLMKKGKAKKADEKDDEWVTLNEKAHSTIMLCLSDDVIIEVADQKTATALLTKLESMPLWDHLKNLNKILLDLRNVDVKVEDRVAALILLVSLPELYENFVESFMTGKETLSLEDVRSALHIREDRQQATSLATESQASGLSATGQKKFGKNKSNSKEVRKVSNPMTSADTVKNQGTGKADDTNSNESVALVADEQPHNNDVWILDSGALYHLCPHKEYFTTYEQINRGNITIANSVVCKVIGIGSIRIRTHDGVLCNLNDVMHVSQMMKNPISLSTFDSKGSSFKGEGSILTGSAETTRSDIHQEVRQRSIAIDKTRRAGVKPPLKYGFEDMMAYALQVAGEV